MWVGAFSINSNKSTHVNFMKKNYTKKISSSTANTLWLDKKKLESFDQSKTTNIARVDFVCFGTCRAKLTSRWRIYFDNCANYRLVKWRHTHGAPIQRGRWKSAFRNNVGCVTWFHSKSRETLIGSSQIVIYKGTSDDVTELHFTTGFNSVAAFQNNIDA